MKFSNHGAIWFKNNFWFNERALGLRRNRSLVSESLPDLVYKAGSERIQSMKDKELKEVAIHLPTKIQKLSIRDLRRLIAYDFWNDGFVYQFEERRNEVITQYKLISELFRNKIAKKYKHPEQMIQSSWVQIGSSNSKNFFTNVVRLSDPTGRVHVSTLWPPLEYSDFCSGIGVTLPRYLKLRENNVKVLLHPITKQHLKIHLYSEFSHRQFDAIGLFPHRVIDHLSLYDKKKQNRLLEHHGAFKKLDFDPDSLPKSLFVVKDLKPFELPGLVYPEYDIGINELVDDTVPFTNRRSWSPFFFKSSQENSKVVTDYKKWGLYNYCPDVIRGSLMNPLLDNLNIDNESAKLAIIDQISFPVLIRSASCKEEGMLTHRTTSYYDSYIWNQFQILQACLIGKSTGDMQKLKLKFDSFLIELNHYRIWSNMIYKRRTTPMDRRNAIACIISTILHDCEALQRIYPNMGWYLKNCHHSFQIEAVGNIEKGRSYAVLTSYLLEAECIAHAHFYNQSLRDPFVSSVKEQIQQFTLIGCGDFPSSMIDDFMRLSKVPFRIEDHIAEESNEKIVKSWNHNGLQLHLVKEDLPQQYKFEDHAGKRKVRELEEALDILNGAI